MPHHGFQGRRAFVTGGSSGIGLETARLLVQAGASVALAARRREPLDEAVRALEAVRPSPSAKILGLPLDVRDRAAVAEAARRADEALGGVDLVINNAGITRPGHVRELPDEAFRDIMDTNYFGAVHVTRAFLPGLVERGSGHVAFVSSVVGFMGCFGYTAYAASKFAMTGFAECLRQELLGTGVSVSILFPPDTDTPQLREENQWKPAETRAIAGTLKTMAPAYVADVFLRGISAGRFHILPGLETRFTHFVHRHAPWLVRWVTDRSVLRSRAAR